MLEYKAGKADINIGFTSPHNDHIIVHDSQGFETGETQNLETVQRFLKDRSRMPELKDKVHAVWICIEVPATGGRILEAGDEAILQLDYGLPVIFVFTKFDLLRSTNDWRLQSNDVYLKMDSAHREQYLKDVVDGEFGRCVDELRDATRGNASLQIAIDKGIPVAAHAKVFAKPPKPRKAGEGRPKRNAPKELDDSSCQDLVDLTKEHLNKSVWITWAIAQRTNIKLNIEASIAIGKRHYWSSITSGLNFQNKTMKDCIGTLHREIIRVWNFDHDACLREEDVQADLTHLVDDLSDPMDNEVADTLLQQLRNGASAGAAMGATFPPAAVVAVPAGAAIGVGLAFGLWCYQQYQKTPGVIRCLMGYIIDLTAVLEGVFVLLQAQGIQQHLSRTVINLALKAYQDEGSPMRRCHQDIRDYVETKNVFQRQDILEKIPALIRKYPLSPSEEVKQQAREAASLSGHTESS